MSYQQISPENLKRTSVMAMVSLAASIAGVSIFPIIGSIVGIVTGNMAKKEIRGSNGTIVGENLAQIGIVISWVSLAIEGIGLCCAVVAALFGLTPVLAEVCIAALPFLGNLIPSSK
jgi:hypothetical protein